MKFFARTICLLLGLLVAGCAATPPATPATWTAGYRIGTNLGDGEPANDMPVPLSLFGRRQLSGPWALGFGLDYMAGDFEEPAKFLGLQQATDRGPIDADATSTQIGVWVERLMNASRRHQFYWLVGLGLASIDVDDVSGPLKGGGKFDIETDGGTETLGMIGLGYRRPLGQHWSFEAVARYEVRMADWEVRDRESGREDTIDDYGTSTFLFGFGYGF